jgi:hypothetical protein
MQQRAFFARRAVPSSQSLRTTWPWPFSPEISRSCGSLMELRFARSGRRSTTLLRVRATCSATATRRWQRLVRGLESAFGRRVGAHHVDVEVAHRPAELRVAGAADSFGARHSEHRQLVAGRTQRDEYGG